MEYERKTFDLWKKIVSIIKVCCFDVFKNHYFIIEF